MIRLNRQPKPHHCGTCGVLIEPGQEIRYNGGFFCSTEHAADDFEFSAP